MSAFWIFAAILTAAYAIYYAVIISIDLYGKKDNPNQTNVETFDIGDIPQETSKAVEVTEGGFRIGGSETRLAQRPASGATESNPPPKLDATGAVITPAQKKISETQAEMEEIVPEMTSEMALATAMSALGKGEPSVDIKKKVTMPEPGDTSKDNRNEEGNVKDAGVPRDRL